MVLLLDDKLGSLAEFLGGEFASDFTRGMDLGLDITMVFTGRLDVQLTTRCALCQVARHGERLHTTTPSPSP